MSWLMSRGINCVTFCIPFPAPRKVFIARFAFSLCFVKAAVATETHVMEQVSCTTSSFAGGPAAYAHPSYQTTSRFYVSVLTFMDVSGTMRSRFAKTARVCC
ncbi:hypothetical protein BDN70DRAFT_309101 [Pholiota conissans]|uniref:Secreted protein n=1 Tax=Pholiota conissans TaxID=109636 RepID=A0A9P5YSC5_9AGAR|nr:hypothetical protein BDN70DRAFT_309101 [Pholiota conissans]